MAQSWWKSDKISAGSWWGFCPHGWGYREYGNLEVPYKGRGPPMREGG